MHRALADKPDTPFRIPTGIKLVRVNHNTGKPARPQDEAVILEALKPEFEFDENNQRVIGSADNKNNNEKSAEYVTNSEDNVQLGSEY